MRETENSQPTVKPVSGPKTRCGVNLRPAGHVIAARDLGQREREKADDDEGDEDDREAVAPGVDRKPRGHREDAGADDRIDAERDHVESPEPTKEPGRSDRAA